jgi:hypothetical protein
MIKQPIREKDVSLGKPKGIENRTNCAKKKRKENTFFSGLFFFFLNKRQKGIKSGGPDRLQVATKHSTY